MASALARGLLVGVLVAAPVGPMALLAIRRTLDRGLSDGLASGLGIATADGLYAAVAAFGLTAVSDALVGHATVVELAGGCVIAVLGALGLVAPAAAGTAPAPDRRGLLAAYGSCLALTLANPPTILSFAALVAGFGVATSGTATAGIFTVGVLLGSMLWWTALGAAVSRGRSAFTPHTRIAISRAASSLLVVLGLALALRAVL